MLMLESMEQIISNISFFDIFLLLSIGDIMLKRLGLAPLPLFL